MKCVLSTFFKQRRTLAGMSFQTFATKLLFFHMIRCCVSFKSGISFDTLSLNVIPFYAPTELNTK